MIETIERLLTLQDRDQRIRALKAELARLPEERKIRERQLAECAARLDKAKTRQREIEVEKKTLEVEAASKRSSIEKYKNQQLQTRKNEEYSALQHEIEAANNAIIALEDREIVLMEEAEALAPALTSAETEYTEEKLKIDRAITALEAKKPNIEAAIADLASARAAAAEGIDEDVLEMYDRLFASKGGNAIVTLEHEVCTGCHMKVTSQTAIEVRTAKAIVHCPNCGRILTLPA